MRAKFLNEKFTEDGDPIKDLGIGGFRKIPPKVTAAYFTKEMRKYGIIATYRIGHYGDVYFTFCNLSNEELNTKFSDVTFYNDRVAKIMDGDSGVGGWFIENVSPEMNEPTYDINAVIKIILESVYGKKETIIEYQQCLKNVEDFLKKYKK